MVRRLALLSLVLFSMPAAAGAQRAESPAPTRFSISSRGSGFGVQGEYEGTYLIRDDRIEVWVTKVTFYVSENCPYQGQRTIDQVKFALGVETGRGSEWKKEFSSEPVAVGLWMKPKDEYTLYDLSFTIPVGKGLDLSKRWLVAEIQTQAVDEPPGQRDGFTYTSSCKDIFLPARAGNCSHNNRRQAAKNF